MSVLTAEMVSLQECPKNLSGMPKTSAKVMVAFGPQTMSLLEEEANQRGVSIQELLRAVIIPEWFRTQTETLGKNLKPGSRASVGEVTRNSLSTSSRLVAHRY